MKRVDVVQAARDRIAELDALQVQHDAERAKLNDFLAMADKLQGPRDEGVAGAVSDLASAIPGATPTPVKEIRKRAVAIIGALGRPVPLAELYQSLLRAGVTIGGKDPRSNLSAKLSGAEELESTGKGWVVRKDWGLAVDAARPHLNGAGASG